ncbi:hypothetical protein E2562_010222 [Oryza meyeriana var. granulata]|uniref:Uncharacterized protein n=1 Tax=Oryza meyeriana var. granulata TaxID=110450 RepID=A0A6G1EIP5_9ORYZ|nr:hypothetical protein E2562_010222 [Oryza meyeriana var. granulata]
MEQASRVMRRRLGTGQCEVGGQRKIQSGGLARQRREAGGLGTALVQKTANDSARHANECQKQCRC